MVRNHQASSNSTVYQRGSPEIQKNAPLIELTKTENKQKSIANQWSSSQNVVGHSKNVHSNFCQSMKIESSKIMEKTFDHRNFE